MTPNKIPKHSQQSNVGANHFCNLGSQKNSMHRKVSAPSESRVYGLQATSERSDYKTVSNMETSGDVRLKSEQVVNLINDGTTRSSSTADTHNKIPQEIEEKILKEVFGIVEIQDWEEYQIEGMKEAISLSFKAGQTQTKNEELEFLEMLLINNGNLFLINGRIKELKAGVQNE